MLTEAEGVAVLTRVFRDAGYNVTGQATFQEGIVRVELDGWDAEKRVGFEYLTLEAHDDAEFTPQVIEELEARMKKGQLHLFLIDEHEIETEEELKEAASTFLLRVKEHTLEKA